MIRLLIFLESGRCWLWDTHNPSNTSSPIWLCISSCNYLGFAVHILLPTYLATQPDTSLLLLINSYLGGPRVVIRNVVVLVYTNVLSAPLMLCGPH